MTPDPGGEPVLYVEKPGRKSEEINPEPPENMLAGGSRQMTHGVTSPIAMPDFETPSVVATSGDFPGSRLLITLSTLPNGVC